MPEDSFNPYHEWLGLDRAVTRPNHYQLLGLAPTEQNVQRIAEAASRAIAKVRGCRPGSRTTEWTQLLELVTAAAACLTDPGRRAEYDRQLGTGAAVGRTYNRPAPRGRLAPAAGGATPALPMQAPQGVPTAYPQGSAGPAGYVDPMAPARPAATPGYGQGPGYGRPQSRPAPAAQGYPSTAQTPLAAARPVAAAPVGRPVVPVAAAPLAGLERSTASRVRSRAKHSNLTLLATCAGVGMLLLAGLIVVIILARNPEPRGRSGYPPVVRSQPISTSSRARSEASHRSGHPAPQGVSRPEAGGTDLASGPVPAGLPSGPGVAPQAPPPSEGELSLPSFPAAPTVEQLAPTTPSTPAAEPEPATPDASPQPAMPAEAEPVEPQLPGPASTDGQPSEVAPMEPQVNEPEPAKAPPQPAEPPSREPAATEPATSLNGVKPEEIAALAKALKSAQAAIQDGQYDAALAELDNLESLPKLPEHHAKYDRLTLVAGYAKEFQTALQSSVAALQPGDEIEVGSSAAVGFVAAAPGSITLRVTGTNRTYALDRLPVGLAVALVDRWLKKDDPVSATIKGAYLASRRGIDEPQRVKARQWLKEGSRNGVEGELHKVLDDQYDLEKDVP